MTPTERIHSKAESDEFVSVSYVAVKPRKRDFLKVLTGRYTPEVRRQTAITLKGMDRELRKSWTAENIAAQLYDSSPLFDSPADGDDS